MSEAEIVAERKKYRVLNDGPGRWAVVYDDGEECSVFETEDAAQAHIDWLLSPPDEECTIGGGW